MPRPKIAVPSEAARWMVVLLGFLTLAFAFSVRGSLSLVLPAWQAEFGWSRSAISAIAATALLVMAGVAPFAGYLVDRHGVRPLLVGGLTAIGIGICMVIRAQPNTSAWLLPVGFAVVAAIGFGTIAQHVIAAAIAQRFDRHRGLATGIGTAGSTAGQLLLMPVLALLVQGGEWRSAFWMLAFGCFGLIPITWLMLREPLRRGAVHSVPTEIDKNEANLTHNLELLMRSPVFHAIFWSYAICGFTTSGVIETHLMPYAAICGFGPVPSATAYGVLSGVNLVGMIAAGWLSDRVHRPRLLAVIYVMRAVSFVVLMFVAADYPRLLVFAVVFGLFDYSTVPVTASYIASRLGLKVLGLSMGLLSAGHAMGGAAGAWAGGAFFDWRGSYGALWGVSVGLVLIAAALVVGLKDERGRAAPKMATLPRLLDGAKGT